MLLGATAALAATFTNPIGPGNDPWAFRWQGQYYLCLSNKPNVVVAKAAALQDLAKAPRAKVWTPPATGAWSKEPWAPELHYLDGKWYIYVAADGGDNFDHRIYVLEGTTQNPQDPFVFKGKISAPTDRWAIDASVLTVRGKNYLIWSGWKDTVNMRQNLYIAPMSNPWTLSGERALISTPDFAWEKQGGSPAVNEGPEALYHGQDVFIIYSASGSWSDYYCLGRLRLTGSDPMDPASWKKHDKAVFSPTDKVFGPGHCSFVKSPDSTEDWIVYHAAVTSGAGWNRNLRIQKFTWNPDGSPDFGTPVPEGVTLEIPSENGMGLLMHEGARGPVPFGGTAGGGVAGAGGATPGYPQDYRPGSEWLTQSGQNLLGRWMLPAP